jgi:hypothetical protein
MRSTVMVVIPMAVIALLLGVFWFGTASPGGCPTALLEGTLEADAATNALFVRADDGRAVTVGWPIGYGPGINAGGEPVLTRLFVQVAEPGDRISMGGGEGQGVDFQGCGVIGVSLAGG